MTPQIDELTFAVMDFETTGLFPTRDRVVEAAVLRIDAVGNILGEYSTLVNPGDRTGGESIHGIDPGLLREAPRFEEVAGDILEMLRDAVWCGHNLGFDLDFLRAELQRIGVPIPRGPCICTMKLLKAVGLTGRDQKLDWACNAMGIPYAQKHFARSDAHAAAELLVRGLAIGRQRGWQRLAALGQVGFASCKRPVLGRIAAQLPVTGRACVR